MPSTGYYWALFFSAKRDTNEPINSHGQAKPNHLHGIEQGQYWREALKCIRTHRYTVCSIEQRIELRTDRSTDGPQTVSQARD